MSEGAQDQASLFKMLAKALEKAIVAGRTSPLDPEKEKRKERDRERMRAQIKESNIELLRRYMACNHKRNTVAMNGTSTIAWANQSDGVYRGTCQRCGCVFSPKKDECFDEKIWKMYDTVVRIPPGNADVQM